MLEILQVSYQHNRILFLAFLLAKENQGFDHNPTTNCYKISLYDYQSSGQVEGLCILNHFLFFQKFIFILHSFSHIPI